MLFFGIPVATAEFSKFAGILSAALSQSHLSGFEIAQLEFHHLQYQKQDLELTVAQIMSSLLQNSGLN